MNKVKARREFYTVEMTVGEGILGYINRVRNLGENLKAMGGELTEMDVAMSASRRQDIFRAVDRE